MNDSNKESSELEVSTIKERELKLRQTALEYFNGLFDRFPQLPLHPAQKFHGFLSCCQLQSTPAFCWKGATWQIASIIASWNDIDNHILMQNRTWISIINYYVRPSWICHSAPPLAEMLQHWWLYLVNFCVIVTQSSRTWQIVSRPLQSGSFQN